MSRISDDEEKFKKEFPNLLKEILENKSNLTIRSIRSKETSDNSEDNKIPDELQNPDVISFIRRADTDGQAIEIINYCLKRGEIDQNYANELKTQLLLYGVRSFGTKKEPGYYEKKYRNK
ncbi:MAG: DUF2095 family protein [Candidatus Helarchaeota archaeon]